MGSLVRIRKLGQSKTQPSFLGTLLSDEMGPGVAEMDVPGKVRLEDLGDTFQWNNLGS